MHGLINRSIQCFIQDMYGSRTWGAVSDVLGPAFEDFEAMTTYDDIVTTQLLDSVCGQLGKSSDEVLEDLGTYLISHPNPSAVRRLLRFGGDTFREFLFTLDDLRDRGRAAVRDLELPELALEEHPGELFKLNVSDAHEGFGYVLLGILRAMADDYGALVFIEFIGSVAGKQVIEVQLLDSAFASGNSFSLGADDSTRSSPKAEDESPMDQEKSA